MTCFLMAWTPKLLAPQAPQAQQLGGLEGNVCGGIFEAQLAMRIKL